MKKIMAITLALLSLSSVSSAKIPFSKVNCQVDTDGSSIQKLPLKPGYTVQYTKKYNYNGHKVLAAFYEGDEYESQQILTMELDGVTSKIYGPRETLHTLENSSGIRIQCFFE